MILSPSFTLGLKGNAFGAIDPAWSGISSAWKMNEASGNALDSVGANILTASGNPLNAAGHVYPTARIVSPGVGFTIAHNSTFAPWKSTGSPFTVIYWGFVDVDTGTTAYNIFSNPVTNIDLNVGVDGGAIVQESNFGFMNVDNIRSTAMGSITYAAWYMVTFRTDGTNISLRTNAGADSTGAMGTPNGGTTQWGFGQANSGTGRLGPVYYWGTRRLTDAEITFHFNGGAGRQLFA